MILNRLRVFRRVFCLRMSNISNALVLDNVRGMKHLDREKFLRNIKLPVLKLSQDKLSNILLICKSYILKLMNFKPVQALGEDEKTLERYIYLDPERVTCWEDIPAADRESLSQFNVGEQNFQNKETLLSYNNFRYDDIFKAVLPEGEETVSGFSQIGHIIHLNLREHLLEYKFLIGAVLVDKIKTCRTVVNKCSIIDNTYRNFKMELVAGDDDFLVTVKESKCTFQFDFSKVYWNPRLGKEHQRILDCLEPGDVLFDVFCGVGPFAVPAAKKKCKVFANDLNPDSYKWLNYNAEQNKVKQFLTSYNLDGKDFICNTFKDFLIDCCTEKKTLNSSARIHITMNLPAMAVEFLKHFNGLISDKELFNKLNYVIMVYVYCFVPGDNPTETAKQLVNDNIGKDISQHILNVSDVRTVSTNKQMMKVVFKLTKEILFGVNDTGNEQEIGEPLSKRQCVESVARTVD